MAISNSPTSAALPSSTASPTSSPFRATSTPIYSGSKRSSRLSAQAARAGSVWHARRHAAGLPVRACPIKPASTQKAKAKANRLHWLPIRRMQHHLLCFTALHCRLSSSELVFSLQRDSVSAVMPAQLQQLTSYRRGRQQVRK